MDNKPIKNIDSYDVVPLEDLVEDEKAAILKFEERRVKRPKRRNGIYVAKGTEEYQKMVEKKSEQGKNGIEYNAIISQDMNQNDIGNPSDFKTSANSTEVSTFVSPGNSLQANQPKRERRKTLQSIEDQRKLEAEPVDKPKI